MWRHLQAATFDRERQLILLNEWIDWNLIKKLRVSNSQIFLNTFGRTFVVRYLDAVKNFTKRCQNERCIRGKKCINI